MGRITRGVKKVVKPMVNFRVWMSWGEVRRSSGNVTSLFKSVFIPNKKPAEESFDDAATRLGIDQGQLQARLKEFQNLSFVFAIATMALFAYFAYLFFEGHLRGAAVCFGVTLISLSMFVRFHLWTYQVRQRKLGCSLREWFWSGLMGRS